MASFGAASINKRTWNWDLDLTDEEPEKKRRSISPELSTGPRHRRQAQAGPSSKPKPQKTLPAPTIDLCTPPKKAPASSSRLAVDIWSSSPLRLTKDEPVKPRHGKSIAIDDPISSSAPLPTRGGRPGKQAVDNFITIDDSDDYDDAKPAPSRPSWMDTESEAEENRKANDFIGASSDSDSDEFPELTSETLKNLPRLTQASSSKSALSGKAKGTKFAPTTRPAAKRAVSEDYAGSKRKPAGDRPAAPKKTAEEKARDKEEKALQREVEKRRKQDEKDKAKLERLAEKEKEKALAEVNKIRTDKKISTPEMIVDLPGSLDRVVRLQTEELLKELKVDCTEWTPPLPNAIRWRRKVTSRYNEALGHWEPRPLTIEAEKTAMVILSAQQFVDLATGTGPASLDAHAASVTHAFPSHNRIYLIEGLELWFRQNAKHRNRAFAEQVRAGLSAGAPVTEALAAARSRRPTTTPAALDESVVRAALITLQVTHSILTHHTDTPLTTSQWIVKFTEFLGTAPYRRQREAVNLASAGFCMESGQVRAGDGVEDTFRRVLQHQARVTPAMAQGIVAEYRTARAMVRALEERGPAALEHVRKGTNRDGGYTDRTVGPAASRRMHKVWTGRGEGSTDI